MTKAEALRIIITDYCEEHEMLLSEFARKCEISKSYMSKIMNPDIETLGISSNYIELIAKNGLNIKQSQLNKLIEDLQEGTAEEDVKRRRLLIEITNKVEGFKGKKLEVLHSIILNLSDDRLEIIHNLLKNMK